MTSENKVVSRAFYVLTGAAFGAALGVLLAPKSGAELREDIADWRRRNGGFGKDMLSRIRGAFAKAETSVAKRDPLREVRKRGEAVLS